jgi:hypothetical protein
MIASSVVVSGALIRWADLKPLKQSPIGRYARGP